MGQVREQNNDRGTEEAIYVAGDDQGTGLTIFSWVDRLNQDTFAGADN